MPKDTTIDLTLISTEDLQRELMSRHEEIIIIREDRKDGEYFFVQAKTRFGKAGKAEIGFDIVCALELLSNAQKLLVEEHFGLTKAEDDVSDSPQDAQESP